MPAARSLSGVCARTDAAVANNASTTVEARMDAREVSRSPPERQALAPSLHRRGSMSTSTLAEAASEFLGKTRVAVTGVSRTPKTHSGNANYRRLRERGYSVFAVNPNATTIEGGCPLMFS